MSYTYLGGGQAAPIYFRETVRVYSSTTGAKNGDVQLYTKYWRSTARPLPALRVQHRAIKWYSFCESSTVNGRAQETCRGVARYGQLLIGWDARTSEESALTLAELREVLVALDRRAFEAVQAYSAELATPATPAR